MNKNVEGQHYKTAENSGRRKVIKALVGGATTIAAYNLLPAKWGTPIIESVFLPAHAATSGISGQYGADSSVVSIQQVNPEELLSDLGEAISDFLVPEANAATTSAFAPYAFVTESTITFKFKYGFSQDAYECLVCTGPVSSSSFSCLASGISFGDGVTFTFTVTSLTQNSISFTIDDSFGKWDFVKYRDSSDYSCSNPPLLPI